MIKYLKTIPGKNSNGFNKYGKFKSFRTVKDMYEDRNK